MKFQIERFVIIFLLIVITGLSLRSCLRKEKENIVLKEAVQIKEDSTSFWKDSLGRIHAQKRLIEADLSSLRTVYRDRIDSITAALQIKSGDLQAALTARTVSQGTVKPIVDTIRQDSVTKYKFHFADTWLTLDGLISSEPSISYRFTDSLVFTTYKKRRNLLRSDVYVDGYSLNPNVRLQNITGIRVGTVPAGRFGIGPYFGYGFTGNGIGPSVGISFHYSLIRF
ncbi:DUF6549 family protein [Chitinophaga ginsengisegetis]|uniref:DUF6549 family protein n=1 Tax=Chitinophaga ginsengisegetis TaxID=393003 RepID=UPI000DBA8F8C|nr:DUF6549 family protein [Chitinophaga ginsengisegetis]MDR6565478.1 hypothetical protein [Chitinophaga ginsengisegetis]MDR6645206.1 hypothetical protein [Chitinophaga ginsengisegetis]MDR6652202.1 hypothetical protein [Chitinophaga ginsengisegetis]